MQLGVRVLLGAERREVRGRLEDLSEGGALVILDDKVPFGAIVRLRFELDGTRCEAMGRVLRAMSIEGRRGIAIEFAHATPPLVAFVRELEAGNVADHAGRFGDGEV